MRLFFFATDTRQHSCSKDEHIPSLLGRACIFYQKNNFVEALKLYKKVLLLNPLAPACVRLGLALCFYRLNSPDVRFVVPVVFSF